MYQALDSRVKGASWWTTPSGSGPVLSGSQWQWDIYNGRHHELMNDNPDKVLTSGDAWNDEDLSAVRLDDSGTATLRQDARLLDRVYPGATAGSTLAFTYEDRSRDGSTTLTWNPVPSSPCRTCPSSWARGSTGCWCGAPTAARRPTELHLPASFPTATTTVVSDLGTVYGPPAYTVRHPGRRGRRARRHGQPSPAAHRRRTRAVLHYALVTNGATAPSATLLAAARSELAAWAAARF